jgi:hypothetical protein
MAEVMDPMLISEQVLLRELKTRFPEVPVDVVWTIMQKVCGFFVLNCLVTS